METVKPVSGRSFLSSTALGGGRNYTIRATLLLLVAACVLPPLLVCIGLVYKFYVLEEARINGETVLIARNLASQLDRELNASESGLRVLSTSSKLAHGDLAGFHRRATDVLRHQLAINYVLIDRSGRQLVNTALPHGLPLPTTDAPPQLLDVFNTGRPTLTGLFTGNVTGSPMVAMGVPVYRGNDIAYVLNAGISTERLSAILNRYRMPDGWVAALLDSQGHIIARSRDAARFVGQKAVPQLVAAAAGAKEGTFNTVTKEGYPVLTSFSRSVASDWTVAVGAPKNELDQALLKGIAAATVGILSTLGIGLLLAAWLGQRLAAAVSGLVQPALMLGSGQPVPDYQTWLREATSVGTALVKASEMLARAQHLARHDALTGLSNRILFDDLLNRQLMQARRHHDSMAVLAIDLDGFKSVNDLYGHAAGDQVLITAAARILGSVRGSDVAARLGGDEFCVLLTNADLRTASMVAQKLVRVLSEPYPELPLRVSASIGVAVYPESGVEGAALMKRADMALYAAKRAGKCRAAVDRLHGSPTVLADDVVAADMPSAASGTV